MKTKDYWLVCGVWRADDPTPQTIGLLTSAYFCLHDHCDHLLRILSACHTSVGHLHQRADPTSSVWIPATSDSSANNRHVCFCLDRFLRLSTYTHTVVSCLAITTPNYTRTSLMNDRMKEGNIWWRGANKISHLSVRLGHSFDLSALKYIVLRLIERYTLSYKYKSVV